MARQHELSQTEEGIRLGDKWMEHFISEIVGTGDILQFIVHSQQVSPAFITFYEM